MIDAANITQKYKIIAAIHGIIDENGIMKGDCLVNSGGYAKKQRCRSWLLDKQKFREDYFINPNNAVKIDELLVNVPENDSLPLEQKLRFTYALPQSGEYRNFTVNLFSDLSRNPFIADERHSDIDFGFLQEYQVYGNFTIPDGYTFESIPENISLIMPDTSIVLNRFLQAEDNLLNVRISVTFKRTYYEAAGYPDFSAFYRKLMDKLNEPVVLKKKSAP